MIFIAALMFVSCGSKDKSIEQSVVEAQTSIEGEIDIDDAIAALMQSDNRPTFNGVMVIPPQRHATVTLFMDGVVKNTTLLSGMYVRRGELLATLENPEYIALQQTYIESNAQEEFLSAEYRRQEMLFGSAAASQKTYQQSKADYLTMKSRREAAAAQLSMLGFDPAKILANGIVPHLELRSPIDGYIANVQANIGAYITAGSPVCEIIDKNAVMLKLTVFERDVSKINAGDKIEFRVNGLGAHVFEATVVSLGQTADNVSRSFEAYARVEERNEQFRPGMYVNAQVRGELLAEGR